MNKRLAVVVTHPIQYYTPVFSLLNKTLNLKVFFTWGDGSINKYDPGFGKVIKWDINLLEGYNYEWVKNTSNNPGSHAFNGIKNPDLLTKITSFNPNAILLFGWAYHSHLAVMRHFKNKIPILFRGDSTLLDGKYGLKNLFKTLFLKWVYRHVDYALYTGTNNKAYFEKYGVPTKRLIFAPHAIDNERFSKSSDVEAKALRSRFGISIDEVVVLFAGKFEQKKNPEILLHAFKNLNISKTSLLFVGNGVLEQKLKKESRLQKNIHFLDFQNQSYMPVIYQACDLFCLPSSGPGETWGLAVNEAMACGKPVLVSDKVGCATDLVKENVNGSIFASNNIKHLTLKLRELITSRSELVFKGTNSFEIVKDWNYNKIVDAILEVINVI